MELVVNQLCSYCMLPFYPNITLLWTRLFFRKCRTYKTKFENNFHICEYSKYQEYFNFWEVNSHSFSNVCKHIRFFIIVAITLT